MDVKYLKADWEKMGIGIGGLIGKGVWGKGAIDDLKDATKNLEEAEEDIQSLDSDNAITFEHKNYKSKYDQLFEDFDVLHHFTGKVGDVVNKTIDEPFHKDIDAFVEAIRDKRIEEFKTDNNLGTTEVQTIIHGTYNVEQKTVKKESITLDDLLADDNFYGQQIKTEFEALQAKGKQDFTEAEYRQAAMNTRAFEYDSIEDQQLHKEFWVDIAALVVVVGATIICPPAGIALGAVYGASQLGSAIVGKDLVSGRELGTQERWMRGALAPLDIIPAAKGIKSFGKAMSGADKLIDMRRLHNIPVKAKQQLDMGIQKTGTMVKEATTQSVARLRNAKQAFADGTRVLKEKAAHGAIEAGKMVDQSITSIKNLDPRLMRVTPDGMLFKETAENAGTVESKIRQTVSKFDVNLKETGRNLDEVPRIKEVEVNFKRNDKHDSEEFARQLKDQEKGMNELTVDEYLKNREKYIEQGRAIEGNAAQQAAREKALNRKVEELFESGMSWEEAEIKSNSWLKTQAALHNPDQIAGGKPLNIGGMGDKRINSSIGSQWRYRIDIVDEKIGELAKLMTPEQRNNTYLNVKLIH